MFYLVFECEIEWWNEDIEFKRISGVRIDHPCLLPCIDNHIQSLSKNSSATLFVLWGKTDRKEGLDSLFETTLLSESALHGEHLFPFEVRIFAFQQFNKLCFVFDQHFGKAHFVCVSQGDWEPILWLRERNIFDHLSTTILITERNYGLPRVCGETNLLDSQLLFDLIQRNILEFELFRLLCGTYTTRNMDRMTLRRREALRK